MPPRPTSPVVQPLGSAFGRQSGLAQGHSPQHVKDLASGKTRPTAIIDLHGYTAAEAWQHLSQWLYDAQAAGHRCVLIITGKGRGPDGMGILKASLVNWLTDHPSIAAYHTALPRDGGQGAMYVLLKRLKF